MVKLPEFMWTPDKIIAETNTWIWDPPGTEVLERADIYLSHRPVGWRSSLVHWSHCQTSQQAEALIEEVITRTQDAGKASILWWLRSLDEPANMADLLQAHGFVLEESSHILARDVATDALDAPHSAVKVSDIVMLEQSYTILHEVFGRPLPSQEELEEDLATLLGQPTKDSRWLIYIQGKAVATAMLEHPDRVVHDRVAHLGGAATLPAYRSQGAYRSLVTARLNEAVKQGQEIAVVRATVGTSEPILKKLGFDYVGTERCYSKVID
ncbi:MAG: GNAT family N-acetyltransferase [Deinococcota bacterium]